MRVKIVKRDGDHARSTQVTDADSGEPLDDVISYRIEADVKDRVVHAVLLRFDSPKRVDPATGTIPKHEARVEVVELDTEAEVTR